MAAQLKIVATLDAGGIVTIDKSIELLVTLPDEGESVKIPTSFPLGINEVETISGSVSITSVPLAEPAAPALKVTA